MTMPQGWGTYYVLEVGGFAEKQTRFFASMLPGAVSVR